MGKDYIAPQDLSAEAGFTVMNPQESVNNLLSNSISAANNSRTNFQSGINQAIAAANSARIAEQNRQNALVLQQQRAAAQADRLKIADQIKRKSEYEDVGNTVKLYDDLVKSGMPAAQAMQAVEARATLGKSIVGEDSPVYDFYSKLTSGGQLTQPQPTGTELTPEDLAVTTQEPINNVDNGQPAQLGAAANVYMPEPQAPMQAPNPMFEAFTRAENAKKAEQRSKIYDSADKQASNIGLEALLETKQKIIPEFAETYGRTDEERAYIRKIGDSIDQSDTGRKEWSKAKEKYVSSSTAMQSAVDETDNFIKLLKELEAKNGGLSDTGRKLLNSMVTKVGSDSGSASGESLFNSLKAEGLINIKDEALAAKLFSSLSSLESKFTSINKNALGNVGTQTENDFVRGMKLVLADGLTDPKYLASHAEKGYAYMNTELLRQDLRYGISGASDYIKNLDAKGYLLSSRGVPYKPESDTLAPAPTVQQPAAPKPSSVNTSRGYKTYNVKPSSFEDELNYFNSL